MHWQGCRYVSEKAPGVTMLNMNPSETRPAGPERFMPDWVMGLVVRVCLVPGIWMWAREHAGSWPQVDPGLVAAAEIWGLPMMSAEAVSFIAVWGGQILCGFLVAGFLTRLSGLGLLLGILAYLIWVSPLAWPIAIVHGAAAFYLFARGGGAFSIDGAIVATAR